MGKESIRACGQNSGPRLEREECWKVQSQQLFITMEEDDNFSGQLASHLFYNDSKRNISLNARLNE